MSENICGARTKTGEPCKRPPMPNGRCSWHGGLTPHGRAHHGFKTGRHSKYLPFNLAEMYEVSVNDPELLDLRSEIALVDSRIAEQLAELQNDTTIPDWKTLQLTWGYFMFAVKRGDSVRQTELVQEIGEIIKHGATRSSAWADLTNMIDNRRKLVDSEGRRLEVKQSMITAEQAMLLLTATISALKEVVYRHVDPQTARNILIDASVTQQHLLSDETGAARAVVTVDRHDQ